MAEAEKAKGDEAEQDQSMEEILQSIKRIITEDGEEGEGKETAEETAAEDEESILELTEVVEEGSEVTEEGDDGANILDDIDAALDNEETPAEAAPEEAAAAPAPAAAQGKGGLIDDDTAATSSQAMERLRSTAEAPKQADIQPIAGKTAAFRNGNTVEDLVMEALTPMLSDWLNTNLPGIVERIVEQEIKRIAPK